VTETNFCEPGRVIRATISEVGADASFDDICASVIRNAVRLCVLNARFSEENRLMKMLGC